MNGSVRSWSQRRVDSDWEAFSCRLLSLRNGNKITLPKGIRDE
ncbi:hypothetical protein ACP_2790 [Acidobacterium capsulatum ATCC 51196]|uniref:Uncharacterized protein n=1 Tax=Acidobacterium capsulatum (strain ATCC 51196 / DSM 11244 / BCRC 80197 / JCM 7670 / NBRC 15755 / NCIMB 13165 / 161) TaxID=240015 RepID=C1F396_ACIC5|nr:hypothetical protein ACP_2790 [Acidobacterium capsulatum ATCC 51196]